MFLHADTYIPYTALIFLISGRSFDSKGLLHNWWSDFSLCNFNAKAKCVIDHYAQFVVPSINLNVSKPIWLLNGTVVLIKYKIIMDYMADILAMRMVGKCLREECLTHLQTDLLRFAVRYV